VVEARASPPRSIRPRALRLAQRLEAETGKALEVAVERDQRRAVLNGESGQVGVVAEIPRRAGCSQQTSEQRLVSFGGVEDLRARVRQPVVDQPQGLVYGQWFLEDPLTCCQPHEPEQGHPSEPQAGRTGIGFRKPVHGYTVLWQSLIDCIEEHVGDNNQKKWAVSSARTQFGDQFLVFQLGCQRIRLGQIDQW